MDSNRAKITSIILAAGKGTRMRSPHLHKVCFQLGGQPVIARSIETYHRCGITNHFVVVGEAMEQVIQAASLAPGNLFFCHQSELLGTGNAARRASDLLAAMDYTGDVLIVAGDKVIEDDILRRFISAYRESESDLALLVGEAADFPLHGKIITDERSRVLGNIESLDLARVQLLSILKRLINEGPVPANEVETLVTAYLKTEEKARVALGSVWAAVKSGKHVTKQVLDAAFSESDYSPRMSGKAVPPELLADVRYANLSVYLLSAPVLSSAIRRISTDNVQREEYLTDIIGIIAGDGLKVTAVPIDYPEQVMAFNTPEELRAIQDYLEGRKSVSVAETPKTVRLASEWLRRFESADGGGLDYLNQMYGDRQIAESKRRMLASMLRNYVSRYADEPVIITRAPGRVNIMGRHIDRQGGYANLIAIDRDLYLVVGARQDRRVKLHNMRSRDIPGREFDADEVVADYDGSDWTDWIDSASIRSRLDRSPGDWSHYVIAPLARFQTRYPHIPIKGMNIVAAGNVPMAAGLSSSSALVVAVAEAIAHINDMDLSPEQFVELCGEGEWYVGTRGGSADHAAMKFAQSGRVIHVSFLPFRMIDNTAFPSEYMFVVCNSQVKAHKTAGARDVFNHRIACYNIARELFKLEFPDLAGKVEHLRDINSANLGVPHAELLKMLRRLPATMTRQEVRRRLPEAQAEEFLRSHAEAVGDYPIRGVMIYGLAECERGRQCAELLRSNKIDEFGRMMNVSHNGDRIVSWGADGRSTPATIDYSDASMDRLISDAEAGLPSADLAMQPGAYACSTPDIDRMVDIALADPNVLGAQILGAGLGGCILVLIPCDAYGALEERMIQHYYRPKRLQPEMFACRPVAGSRVVLF